MVTFTGLVYQFNNVLEVEVPKFSTNMKKYIPKTRNLLSSKKTNMHIKKSILFEKQDSEKSNLYISNIYKQVTINV